MRKDWVKQGFNKHIVLRQAPKGRNYMFCLMGSRYFNTGIGKSNKDGRVPYPLIIEIYANGHSAQSDLLGMIHQYAAFCYLLTFLCST